MTKTEHAASAAKLARQPDLKLLEVADLVGVPERTVMRWVAQGKILARRIDGEYVVSRKELQRWGNERGICVDRRSDPPSKRVAAGGGTTLVDALRSGGVLTDLPGDDVETVLRAAVWQFSDSDTARRGLLEALIDRERMASTGIGRGVAIPHPRAPLDLGLSSVRLTACLLKEPVDWGAVDGEPVFAVFVLVAPTTTAHLESLARLGFCLHEPTFISFLKQCRSPDSLLERIGAMEQSFERRGQ